MKKFLLPSCLFAATLASFAGSAQSPSLTLTGNHPAARHDRSQPLSTQISADTSKRLSPDDDDEEAQTAERLDGFKVGRGVLGRWRFDTAGAMTKAAAVEQTWTGSRPAPALLASFDGLGEGFSGPQGTAFYRNPSDNALAVGPDHIFQIVNTRMAIYTKKGKKYDTTGRILYGPGETRSVL